jgi:response regulator RpfG family c-di-GMP phosphodiesterase
MTMHADSDTTPVTLWTDEPSWRILCVDDEANILSALRRLFRQHGYHINMASSGADALALMQNETFDLIISDMRMPGMDGATFLKEACMQQPDAVRLLLTGHADIQSTIAAVNQGQISHYITKPWDDTELLHVVKQALEIKGLQRDKARLEAITAQQNVALKELNQTLEEKVQVRTQELALANEKLKASFITSVKVFSNLIEMRGGLLAGHSRRVADWSRKIASQLHLPAAVVQDIFLAGLLHDIGKIGLPDGMLSKPVTHMNGEELAQNRKHTVKGEQALMALEDLRNAARFLRSHHERFDGEGYPDGLAGHAIPLGARILAVANDYDGLQHGILSQRRFDPDEARKVIVDGSGKRYDPQVVEAFLRALVGHASELGSAIALDPADLRSGMVLARDLLTREGVLLLSADHKLNDSLIRQIHEYVQTEGELSVSIRTDGRQEG